MDVAFLASYAAGMYAAGAVGDRIDLRLFLAAGMAASGAAVCAFGAAQFLGIHSLAYFIAVQVVGGLLQATGWPCVVSVMANWHGKGKRGLVFGVWNSHTSVGNIVGSLVAARALSWGWGWSFVLPGAAHIACGAVVYLCLVAHPADVGLVPAAEPAAGTAAPDEEAQLLTAPGASAPASAPDLPKLVAAKPGTPISFADAWLIPGVAPFAFCLFFAKLVAYTFLYWLPYYIRHTKIAGRSLSDAQAGNLSTLFDVGGVVGGIVAGQLSDRFQARACTAAAFTYLAIPALWAYSAFGHVSMPLNVGLMMLAGVLVNGPYALITTAVSADLGTHPSIKSSSRALATVTAIIDGTGSIGAALGPLLTGFLSELGGDDAWKNVFYMLMLAALAAALFLTKLVVVEVREALSRQQPTSHSVIDDPREGVKEALIVGRRGQGVQ
eukprot:SM000007S20878  [mRNA]  locus=s7:701121:703294:+ [translate_table: standard]